MTGKILATTDVAPELEVELLKLTAMQRRYFEGRVIGLKPSEAARAAGSEDPGTFAHKCERHPRIHTLLKHISAQVLKKAELTREDVLEGLQEAVRAAATSTEMTAAWREIGKVIGAYAPTIVEVHDKPTAKELRSMTDEQLLELAEQDSFALPEPNTLVQTTVTEITDGDFEVIHQSEDKEVIQESKEEECPSG